MDGLLLDAEHPRKDANSEVKAAVQRDYAEWCAHPGHSLRETRDVTLVRLLPTMHLSLQQLSLFAAGREAMSADPSVAAALQTLACVGPNDHNLLYSKRVSQPVSFFNR
eukprot:SAG11_NODE_86_length_17300_cov_11.466717_19_plen_109_part_00